MYKRILDLSFCKSETCFLWGPRQTGKSTLLRQVYPDAKRYDLLLSDEFRRLSAYPSILRQECEAAGLTGDTQRHPIIVDEVQKVPLLLDEIHWLIENKRLRFLLCGSSARKLKRGHANLLGGRAIRYELHPLVFPEIPDFSLSRALNNGLLPRFYLSDRHTRLIRSYVGDYLREEIAAEALARNIGTFDRFLEAAALTNGEIVNFVTIAQDCAVSAPTAKAYFTILQDTLLGDFLPAYRKRAKRRLVSAPKFYFFDVGLVNELAHRGRLEPRSELFGRAFEHLIYCQLKAHTQYSELFYPITHWKTASQFEVDFILGDHDIALEVKSTALATNKHLHGLRAFKEEFTPRRALLVSLDEQPRKTEDGIEILPWRVFLEQLWGGGVFS